MFRSFVLSTVSAILVCGPAFAGGMSATSGSGSIRGSSTSMGNTSVPIQSGFSSGTTTTGRSSTPTYRPHPVARPVVRSVAPGLRFLAQNQLGYSVYSNGRTLYIRGLTQAMVERYQIKLGTLVNNLMTAYPGHQSVQLF